MGSSTESASFIVNLEDNTSGAAMSAATALQRLRDSIQGELERVLEAVAIQLGAPVGWA